MFVEFHMLYICNSYGVCTYIEFYIQMCYIYIWLYMLFPISHDSPNIWHVLHLQLVFKRRKVFGFGPSTSLDKVQAISRELSCLSGTSGCWGHRSNNDNHGHAIFMTFDHVTRGTHHISSTGSHWRTICLLCWSLPMWSIGRASGPPGCY